MKFFNIFLGFLMLIIGIFSVIGGLYFYGNCSIVEMIDGNLPTECDTTGSTDGGGGDVVGGGTGGVASKQKGETCTVSPNNCASGLICADTGGAASSGPKCYETCASGIIGDSNTSNTCGRYNNIEVNNKHYGIISRKNIDHDCHHECICPYGCEQIYDTTHSGGAHGGLQCGGNNQRLTANIVNSDGLACTHA